MTDAQKIELAQKAIRYTLDRAQTDADFGYLLGPHQESFRLLCEAEAAFRDVPVADVEKERGKSIATYPRRFLSRSEHRELEERDGNG